MATKTDSYAIISLGGKQYRVREGERLLVDRLKTDEGMTFHPDVLFLGGDGTGQLAPSVQVTAKVVGHVLGDQEASAPKPKKDAAPPPVAAEPPRGYADFTVAEIAEKSKRWRVEQLKAALTFEREHAERKGAITALESAIAAKREKEG